MLETDRTRRTYRYELFRAGTAGILETAGTTFLLLIAVRWFSAGALAKGLVAGAGSLGLLLSPLVVSRVSALGWPAGRAASWILAGGGVSFLVMAVVPWLPVYVVGSVLGMASSAAVIPLLTQMYQENYPAEERGRRFSRTVMIRIAMAAVFSKVAGDALSGQLRYFPFLLVVFAMALGFASFCVSRCPTRPIAGGGGSHPLRALRFAVVDRQFGRILICWMLMGFGNLMMLPLRVEYLANPKYGLSYSVGLVAMLIGVVPNLARLVLSPFWGYLFDRMNFFTLRAILNLGFAAGILIFFLSDSVGGIVVGALVYGVTNAGGDVAWGLWVIKFAPAERVAEYMSVHTFLTGIRGVMAPLLAFYLTSVGDYSLMFLGLVSCGLILAGTFLLVPEIGQGFRRRPFVETPE